MRNVVLCAATLLVACSPKGVTYSPLVPIGDRSPKATTSVELHLEGEAPPSCTVKSVGLLHGQGRLRDSIYSCSQAETLDLIRAEAARLGVDGVWKLACAAPGLVGYDNCSCAGQAYVCE